MQSIACIVVIYARVTLRFRATPEESDCCCMYWFFVGFNTHTFLLPIFVFRNKGLCSTAGLYGCVKMRYILVIFLCLIQDSAITVVLLCQARIILYT